MSRDIIVQDIPVGIASVAEIPDGWMPAALPFGHVEVVAAVVEIAPGADVSDSEWLIVDLPGVSVEVNTQRTSPFTSFALHVRGDSASANVFISRLLSLLGSRALDMESDSGLFEY